MSTSKPVKLTVQASDGSSHELACDNQQSELPLSELLRHANFPLNTRCGGRGLCEGCVIELLNGELYDSLSGESVEANSHPLVLRACLHHPMSDASIRIPARSSVRYTPRIVSDYRINIPFSHQPLLQQIDIDSIDAAGLTSSALASMAHGRSSTLPVHIAESVEQMLPLSRGAGEHTATIEHAGDHLVVTSLSPTKPMRILGAAVDIGTTTVAAMVVDLSNGAIIGRAAAFNEQMHLGDDVLTRINLCSTSKDGTHQLKAAVADATIRPLLDRALAEAGAEMGALRCVVFAGNTTMLHLLAGVDPSSMGIAPFTPVFVNHRVEPASGLFENFALHAKCHLLPGASAYVGADITAGVVASGLLYDEGPSMLVDVGTNGEIVLKHGDELFGCATAAGPAFEGSRLSSGMRAGDGAISHVRMSRQPFSVEIETIGEEHGSKPIGICGSAYVDFLAQAHASGVMSATGQFERSVSPEHVIEWGRKKYLAFRLANAPGNQPIVVSQRDVASLLQAKAAIAAGILTLLERRGLHQRDVKTLYLAGGFGTHLDRTAAIACGLLPGFSIDQIQPVGNTSLAGAYLALMDSAILDEISEAGRRMKVIELNLDPNFEERYIDQLSIPE